MTPHEMQPRFRNLEHRTARLEQFLPTLATKDDLAAVTLAARAELAAAIAPLATKAELAAAVAPLATKAELAAGLDEVRRHTSVLIEDVRDDIRLLAEHLATVLERRSGHH